MSEDDDSKKPPESKPPEQAEEPEEQAEEQPEVPASPHETFDAYAKRRSVVEVLMRFLEHTHVKSDADPSRFKPIICEEVAHSRAIVEQEIIHDMLHHLGLWENVYRTKMNEFRTVRMTNLPFPIVNGSHEPTPEKKPDPQAKPGKKKPGKK